MEEKKLTTILLSLLFGFTQVNTYVFAEEEPEQPETTEETRVSEPDQTKTDDTETEEVYEDETKTEEETYYNSYGNYEYDIVNGEAEITLYTGEASSLTIPSSIRGYPVTGIATNAFSSCYGLETVIIPDSVVEINYSAFCACQQLTKVVIPASVETAGGLGWGMFDSCGSLNSAGPIGSGNNIEFGWSEEIPENAFNCCESLSFIQFPNGLKRIGEYAFAGTGLVNVRIPNGVESIGNNAFCRCPDLAKVIIPASVTEMGSEIFAESDNLKTAGPMGSGSDVEFGWTDTIPDNSFSRCSNFTKVTIPESVTSINGSAFNECSALTSVGPVGSGAGIEFGWKESIPDNAFDGFYNLEKVIIPGTVKKIGDSIFQNCSKLTTAGPIGSGADIEFGWTDSIPANAFSDCEMITSIQIPDTVTEIGANAFSWCTNLKEIVLPEGLKTIESGLFENDISLKQITVPDGVTEIKSSAFAGCSGLNRIIIPESVTKTGSHAFEGCKGLITAGPIGSGANYQFGWTDTIPTEAFGDCTNLIDIQIPDTVRSIGSYAFYNCQSLTEIELPPALYEIGYGLFMDDNILHTVSFSNTVRYIFDNAFAGCTNLKTVYFDGTKADWSKIKISQNNDPLSRANIICLKETPSSVPTLIRIDEKGPLEMITGSTRKLKLVVEPAGSENAVKWESTNPKVVIVDSNGNVTAKGYGTAQIRAYYTGEDGTGIASGVLIQTRFNDVADSTQSYYKPVYWGADNGVVAGYNGGEYFGPDNECTRGQFVTFLWRLAGRPTVDQGVSFPDVDESANYYRAVKWAVSKGIIVGYKHDDGTVTFEPESEVTRGQTAVMLWRFAGRPKVNTSVASPFNDIDAKNNQYRAVLWGQQAGVIKGYKDGSFQPDGSCLRQHIVTFFYRYARDVMKRKV